jgi:hypothetical protein
MTKSAASSVSVETLVVESNLVSSLPKQIDWDGCKLNLAVKAQL